MLASEFSLGPQHIGCVDRAPKRNVVTFLTFSTYTIAKGRRNIVNIFFTYKSVSVMSFTGNSKVSCDLECYWVTVVIWPWINKSAPPQKQNMEVQKESHQYKVHFTIFHTPSGFLPIIFAFNKWLRSQKQNAFLWVTKPDKRLLFLEIWSANAFFFVKKSINSLYHMLYHVFVLLYLCSCTIILVGGFNPIDKNWSKWESSPNRGEHKKYLKPPPSIL